MFANVFSENIDHVTEETSLLFEPIHQWLDSRYVNGDLEKGTAVLIVYLATIVIAILAYFLFRFTVVTFIHRISKKTKTTWDDTLKQKYFFTRLAHIVPAMIIFFSAEFLPIDYTGLPERIAYAYLAIIITLVASALLATLSEVYTGTEHSKNSPITPFLQMAKLFLFAVGFVFFLSALMGKDPWGMIAGLGALTAVLLLVFKDSILGLVASVQFLVNDLVGLGDWIEVPHHGADGTVIDIQLTTIKVQNWDNTITSFPTYSLISGSFKNWRGMQKSDGRQMKRSVYLDLNSIRFCTPEMLQKYQKIRCLEEYLTKRLPEVTEANNQLAVESPLINGRRLTNVGMFRVYLLEYLKTHDEINTNLTVLVRQLQATDKGLPIQIYCYIQNKDWVEYESIQSDIFDHILSIAKEFDLKIFQSPTGLDWKKS